VACRPRTRRAHSLSAMGTKSREYIYGSSIRASAERAAEARRQADRLACEAWNQRMLGFQGPAPTLADLGRCGQRWLSLSRSQMPWLRHASDGAAEHRPASEGDAHPRIGTLYALQGLLAGSRLPVQAQPPRGTSTDQDFRERSTLDVVAGGAVN
jgi:hypothetical protein